MCCGVQRQGNTFIFLLGVPLGQDGSEEVSSQKDEGQPRERVHTGAPGVQRGCRVRKEHLERGWRGRPGGLVQRSGERATRAGTGCTSQGADRCWRSSWLLSCIWLYSSLAPINRLNNHLPPHTSYQRKVLADNFNICTRAICSAQCGLGFIYSISYFPVDKSVPSPSLCLLIHLDCSKLLIPSTFSSIFIVNILLKR